jgi:hypothetical protein
MIASPPLFLLLRSSEIFKIRSSGNNFFKLHPRYGKEPNLKPLHGNNIIATLSYILSTKHSKMGKKSRRPRSAEKKKNAASNTSSAGTCSGSTTTGVTGSSSTTTGVTGVRGENELGAPLGIITCLLKGQKDLAKEFVKGVFGDVFVGCGTDGDATVHCHCCHQHQQGETIHLLICSCCKVNHYCKRSHQKKKRRGRFSFISSHKMLSCPFLKRWRRVKREMKEEKPSRDSYELILDDLKK